MSDRERGPSIGDWDDAAAGGEGDDDGSEAGLAGTRHASREQPKPRSGGLRDQDRERQTARSRWR